MRRTDVLNNAHLSQPRPQPAVFWKHPALCAQVMQCVEAYCTAILGSKFSCLVSALSAMQTFVRTLPSPSLLPPSSASFTIPPLPFLLVYLSAPFKWCELASEGLTPRYEHAAFSTEGELGVFGGAVQTGPLNDVWRYNRGSHILRLTVPRAQGIMSIHVITTRSTSYIELQVNISHPYFLFTSLTMQLSQ